MLSNLRAPRAEISPHAPRLLTLQINPDKIGLLIGPGGKTIKAIQESTGAKIDIEDDGTVYISHSESAGAEAAKGKVEALCEEVKVGKIYEGTVRSLKDFGAFVEIAPGRDGLCHVSELAEGFVSRPDEVVKVGERIRVKVVGIDDQDRIKLSRKAVLREESGYVPPPAGEAPPPREERARREGGNGGAGGGRGGRGGREQREPREVREPREGREPREPREPRDAE
jgi:polyribonucleotide nucleotidyltransferase